MLRRCLPLIALLALAACGDPDAPPPVQPPDLMVPEPDEPHIPATAAPEGAFPASIRFLSAPDLHNRHLYAITQPPWRSPHQAVGLEVWRTSTVTLNETGSLTGDILDEPAPYTRSTPMVLEAQLAWTGKGANEPDQVEVHLEGVLRSTTQSGLQVRIVDARATLDAIAAQNLPAGLSGVAFAPFSSATDTLPSRVDVWDLELTWTLTPTRDGAPTHDAPRVSRTHHLIPTLLRDPLPNTPLYKRPIVWASTWAAGEWDDYGPDDPRSAQTEHLIAMAEMEGMRSLADLGFRYGAFRRPSLDQITERVDLFLDFQQVACGEFRSMLIDLIEVHGIDARWVWLRFPTLDSQHYALYKTRFIAPIGQPAAHWFNTNHIVVTVNGQVYDPTYTVHAESWRAYEDWMFERYCLGQDTSCGAGKWCTSSPPGEVGCIDNPAGFDPSWDMRVIEADGYR